MKESISEKNKNENGWSQVRKNIEKFGVGHIGKVQFSSEDIPVEKRQEILGAYSESTKKIEALSEDISTLLGYIQIDEEKQKIFDDFKSGVETALSKTINQILYHGKVESKESINAFDEFAMLLEIVHQSFINPKILDKKAYKDSTIYQIAPPQSNVEHREPLKTDILLSKNHIAWNVVSQSLYNARGEVKSGIRLDYNPLYKKEAGKIDKSKTEWTTSIDISGFYIDKILNQYSLRGHHFPKIFHYKVGLIIPGFSNSLEKYLDSKETIKD